MISDERSQILLMQMLERDRARVKRGSRMTGRIVMAPVHVEGHGLARSLVSRSGEFHPCPVAAQPVRNDRKIDSLRMYGILDGKSDSTCGG
jgi:hypothetical protein